jgi:hypothetical protein
LERIKKQVKILGDPFRGFTDEQKEKFLIAKIMIHEFAHALMDIGLERNKTNNDFYMSDFYKWVEEPMANKIALIFSLGDDSFFDFTKNFINEQPYYYKPGIEIFNNKIDWEKWWKYKKNRTDKDKEIEKDWTCSLRNPQKNERVAIYEEILKSNQQD